MMVVFIFLKIMKSIDSKDSFGYAPLHIAALNEYSYCASLLLTYGADVTIRLGFIRLRNS